MNTKTESSLKPILIIGALFFIFGFITWLNSVLIPYLKIACELNNFEAYFVTFAFYIAYFVMALPSSRVLKMTGFKSGMSVGLAVIALGALIFIPAALTRTYGLFLLGLFIQGTGLTILQTASNPYITILGPPESAAKRISIMGICNKVAGAIAPLILGAIALKDADAVTERIASMDTLQKAAELDALASRVIAPYIIIVLVLGILAVVVRYSSLPEVDTDSQEEIADGDSTRRTSIWQFPYLLLGVLALFLYVGAEVIAVDTIINYASFHGISLEEAKYFAIFTLIAMIVGYIIGIVSIPRYITQDNALKVSAILGVIFSVAAVLSNGSTSVLFIALLGLANSLMWPAIWPLAIGGLGKFTKTGSSLLIMAIAGGALLPLVYGRLADSINPQHAYWLLLPCYLFIWYFASSGHKVGKSDKFV